MKIAGYFISVWDGQEIETRGILNTQTGEIVCETIDIDDLMEINNLDDEFFTDVYGHKHQVCPNATNIFSMTKKDVQTLNVITIKPNIKTLYFICRVFLVFS